MMTEDTLSSTHPLLPPTQEDDRISWLRLLRSYRVGISTFYRLMSEHGDANTALQALPQIARDAGVRSYRVCSAQAAQDEYRKGYDLGARMICRGEAEYPKGLAALNDAPPFFWALGDVGLLAKPMVALVGARNASSLGTRMAKGLARGLGEAGFVVVSGLARGVDAAAHLGSLETGTIAVQGGGVDIIYPRENAELAEKIATGGLRLSEQAIGMQPQAGHFPARNRLISGLSQAVIVVEAAPKSGSLITARCALDQGKEVLAVPGHPFDARAGGGNMLIRDGARLVRNAEDVIEALQPEFSIVGAPKKQAEARQLPLKEASPEPKRDLATIAKLHSVILSRLGPSPLAEDQLVRDLGEGAKRVAPVLTELELEGLIARRPGGLIARTT